MWVLTIALRKKMTGHLKKLLVVPLLRQVLRVDLDFVDSRRVEAPQRSPPKPQGGRRRKLSRRPRPNVLRPGLSFVFKCHGS